MNNGIYTKVWEQYTDAAMELSPKHKKNQKPWPLITCQQNQHRSCYTYVKYRNILLVQTELSSGNIL